MGKRKVANGRSGNGNGANLGFETSSHTRFSFAARITCVAYSILFLCCRIAPAEGLPSGDGVPSYELLSKHLSLPGTKRIFLQQPCDYKIVEGRPDLKFLMKDATATDLSPTGFGFILIVDGKPQSFDFKRTEQHFARGALPLLTQRIVQAGFVFQQTSFTTEDAAGRRLVMVRLQIRRAKSSSPRVVKLGWLSVRSAHARYYSHENEDYIVFEPWSPGWKARLPLRCDGGVQHDGETIFSAIRPSDNVSIAAGNNVAGALALTVSFANCSEAQIEMIVPYEGLPASMIRQEKQSNWRERKAFTLREKERLLRLSFDEEYARQAERWERCLGRAAAIQAQKLW